MRVANAQFHSPPRSPMTDIPSISCRSSSSYSPVLILMSYSIRILPYISIPRLGPAILMREPFSCADLLPQTGIDSHYGPQHDSFFSIYQCPRLHVYRTITVCAFWKNFQRGYIFFIITEYHCPLALLGCPPSNLQCCAPRLYLFHALADGRVIVGRRDRQTPVWFTRLITFYSATGAGDVLISM